MYYSLRKFCPQFCFFGTHGVYHRDLLTCLRSMCFCFYHHVPASSAVGAVFLLGRTRLPPSLIRYVSCSYSVMVGFVPSVGFAQYVANTVQKELYRRVLVK